MNEVNSLKPAMDLIYLVSCAVNSEKPDNRIVSDMDLSAVQKAALDHSFSVAAAAALEQVIKLPEMLKEEKYKAIRRLSLLSVEREKVFSALEEERIDHLPLKGIVINAYYPKSAMREMADNDILFDKNKAQKVKSVMESLGFKCKHFGKNHHDVYEKPPRLDFEMHRTLFDPANDQLFCDYYDDIWDRLIKDDGNSSGYHMTNEDFYIHLICHLYKHYSEKGTGLRSLLDIYVFRKTEGESLDKEYLENEFKKLNLDEFERAIKQLAQKLFTRQPLSETEQSELSFFIESKTHGTMDNLLSRRLKNDDSSNSKAKYALKRIFPPQDYVKKKHPFVYRHKAVYPFWVLYRPVKGALKHRKKMFGEIKRLKSFRKKENTGTFNK